jgi:hypothetical protein
MREAQRRCVSAILISCELFYMYREITSQSYLYRSVAPMLSRYGMLSAILILFGAVAGCAQRKEPEFTYTSNPKMNKILDECYYEALKALHAAPANTAAAYGAKQIFAQCLKVKGYKEDSTD